jgi:hypothetical protein
MPHFQRYGMDSIILNFLDRINRIFRIFLDRFPEENGQTLCARGAQVAFGKGFNLYPSP